MLNRFKSLLAITLALGVSLVGGVTSASDGTLDADFGSNGYFEIDRVIVEDGVSYKFESELLVATGATTVALVGTARQWTNEAESGDRKVAVLQLRNGAPDTTYSTNGFAIIDIPIAATGTGDARVHDAKQTSSGLLILGRYDVVGSSGFKHTFALQLSSSGTLNTSWGSESPANGLALLTSDNHQGGSVVGAIGADSFVLIEQDISSNTHEFSIQAFSIATGAPVAFGARTSSDAIVLPSAEGLTYSSWSPAGLALLNDVLVMSRVDFDRSSSESRELLGFASFDLSGGDADALSAVDISLPAELLTGGTESVSYPRMDGSGRLYFASTVRDDTGPSPITVVRFTSGGVVDTSFGTSGVLTTVDVLDTWGGLGFQIDGEKLVFEGREYDSSPEVFADTFVVRVSMDGTLDATFGTDGYARIDLVCTVTAGAGELVITSSGKYVVASTKYNDEIRAVSLASDGDGAGDCSSTPSGGGGGGGDYTEPDPVSPAPTFSVGQSNGALVVCVAMNNSPATFLSTTVFPTDFQFGQFSNGDLLPDTNVQRTITGIADGAEAFPRAEEWDGADVAIAIPQQRMLVYNDDWEADDVFEAQDWEIGTEYRVSLFASQVETSFMDQPIAQSMLEPVLYTFAATDTDCGIEPPAGTGSSSPTTPTTVPSSGVPSLVTSSNQELLAASAGSAKILIDGELVEVELVQASEELRRTVGGARTFEQVRALQTLAVQMVTAIQGVLGDGVELPITVTNVDTGATISGLVTDPVTGVVLPVPVEDVLLILNENLVLMVGGADGTNNPANIAFDGVLEFGEGGYVAVLAYGLTPGAAGEVVVMSTPQLLDTFTVDTDGGVAAQAAIPADIAPGEHTVVVAVDGQSASLGFRVLSAGTLPVTGGSSSLPSALAVLLAAVGAFGVLVVSRRRHTA